MPIMQKTAIGQNGELLIEEEWRVLRQVNNGAPVVYSWTLESRARACLDELKQAGAKCKLIKIEKYQIVLETNL